MKFKEPRERIRFLSDDERKNLLTACKKSSSHYLYIVVVLCLSTGARKMEILSLRWNDIDLQRNVITLHKTKNGERRVLPITNHALELIKEHAKIRNINSDFVFPGKNPKTPVELKNNRQKH